MLFRRCAADQNVVEIHENEIESVADGIHQSLKSLRCVLQTKWCPKELEEAEWCDDCSLGLLAGQLPALVTVDSLQFTGCTVQRRHVRNFDIMHVTVQFVKVLQYIYVLVK